MITHVRYFILFLYSLQIIYLKKNHWSVPHPNLVLLDGWIVGQTDRQHCLFDCLISLIKTRLSGVWARPSDIFMICIWGRNLPPGEHHCRGLLPGGYCRVSICDSANSFSFIYWYLIAVSRTRWRAAERAGPHAEPQPFRPVDVRQLSGFIQSGPSVSVHCFFPFIYFICQRWQRSTPFDHPLSLSCIMSMLLCIRCVSVTLLIFLWLNKMSALILWVAAVNSTWFLLDLEICVYAIVFIVSFRFSCLC